jgi:putative tryptophan/tyrosine transport system substrate-binding protein
MSMNKNPNVSIRRIGILEMASPDRERLALWNIFKHRLAELGYPESSDLEFQFRWAEGRQENLASAADDLVRMQVDVLVTAGTPAAAAASRATTDIPVIMATGVGLGTELTDGTKKRNANVTGISDLPPGLSAQRLSRLRQAIPGATTFAILADRANPSSPLAVRETKEAANGLELEVRDYWVAGPEQIGDALAAMAKDRVGGFIVAPGAMFFAKRHILADFALQHRLPAVSVRREYAEAGCVMAYGSPISENYRQAADFVSLALSGTKPADLPVHQPTAFEFVVNLKSAAAMGLTLPPSLLEGAEVIH